VEEPIVSWQTGEAIGTKVKNHPAIASRFRFDELQSVAINNLEPSEWTLADDVVAVLSSQLSFFLMGPSAEQYLCWRSELQKQT
jgi:hypothetical protein